MTASSSVFESYSHLPAEIKRRCAETVLGMGTPCAASIGYVLIRFKQCQILAPSRDCILLCLP